MKDRKLIASGLALILFILILFYYACTTYFIVDTAAYILGNVPFGDFIFSLLFWNPKPAEHCVNPERTFCPGSTRKTCRGDINMLWSLGFGRSGKDPFDTVSKPNLSPSPIQTGWNIKGLKGLFVADPHLLVHDGVWWVFTEVLNNECQKGEIGVHYSKNEGTAWNYGGIALAEPFHLSFPFVIIHDGQYFMTTCATAGSPKPADLWLYRAIKFPYRWSKFKKILKGQTVGYPIDPVLKLHNGVWFLFVLDDGIMKERLFFSRSLLEEEFKEHPQSQKYLIRQSGQIVTDNDGMMWAFHHEGGVSIHRWHIKKLSISEYSYGEKFPLLDQNTGVHWASSGMHTFSATNLHNGNWIAIVDGWKNDPNTKLYRCLERGDLDCWRLYPCLERDDIDCW